MRGQSKFSEVGTVEAAEACVAALDCDPPPNRALMRSPNGTEPVDADVVPSAFDPNTLPLVLQPARTAAATRMIAARALLVRHVASAQCADIVFICPANSPAPAKVIARQPWQPQGRRIAHRRSGWLARLRRATKGRASHAECGGETRGGG